MKFDDAEKIVENVDTMNSKMEVYKKPNGVYGIKSDNAATEKGGIPASTKLATSKILKCLKQKGLLSKLDPDNETIKDIQPINQRGDVKIFFDDGGSTVIRYDEYSRF